MMGFAALIPSDEFYSIPLRGGVAAQPTGWLRSFPALCAAFERKTTNPRPCGAPPLKRGLLISGASRRK